MILYPAIDLKDGACVRLLRGEMEAATVFGTDPAAQARAFQDAGCRWLHLVDLNGAFAGAPVNGAAVEGILAAVTVPVQLGGGIRDRATIEAWLDAGVHTRRWNYAYAILASKARGVSAATSGASRKTSRGRRPRARTRRCAPVSPLGWR